MLNENFNFVVGKKYVILYLHRSLNKKLIWFRKITVKLVEPKTIIAHDSRSNNELRTFTKKYIKVMQKI